ncbi:MAG: PepSY domain-containing protein [Methanomicrobium sp.]|nr:PepSY domain-containing protein [Methanomicrobium sp.]
MITLLSGGCVDNMDKPGAEEPVTTISTMEYTNAPTNSGVDGTLKVKLPGPVEPPVDPVSYDERTKELLVNNAKNEILRVFPEVKESSLDNYKWDENNYGGYYASVIVFEDVIDESKKKERVAKNKWFTEQVVEIAVDPETGSILEYIGFTDSSGTPEGIISYEKAKEHAMNYFINVIGEEQYNKNKDKYFIYVMDNKIANKNDMCSTISLFIHNSHNGVKYMGDRVQITYDLAIDAVESYANFFRDPEFHAEITTLSPVPDVTLDEAKKILEAKLNENNPGKDLKIEYHENYEGAVLPSDYYSSLYWMDSPYYMSISDGYVSEPLKLVWRFYFNTEHMRNNPNETVRQVCIDAHTGEIVYLKYAGISIPADIR